MKNAFIAGLILLVAILAFGTRDEAQAMIEDTTFHHAKWKPAEGMLFLPCPVMPRNHPRHAERNA